ncbi:Protein shisa-9 [Fukomys damarensis]|uniref:Protein shisa-9 n=1 Tax=Fukomys damarensis TaxID=885580 RepID=A0A091CTV0_FUKDA|nr:Protein shisa-9 [Fukomys damarensis]
MTETLEKDLSVAGLGSMASELLVSDLEFKLTQSSGDFIFCCGTCGFRFCCTFKKRRLNQSTCTNYDTPLWLNTGKPPARKDDPLHDPTKDKTNLIVYIICGVVAVMVLVGIFTKLGLEKAHRPQREHMSRALADVMRPQGHCNTDHMERDLNIVVHVQHYENMDTRAPINNLRKYSSMDHFRSHMVTCVMVTLAGLTVCVWVSEELLYVDELGVLLSLFR